MGAVTLLLVLNVGCSPQSVTISVPNDNENKIIPTLTTAPPIAPIITPTEMNMNTSIEMQMPYSKNSIWNTPIGDSPKYDLHSGEMISNLILSHEGQITTAGEAYNYPVYFADEQTPRWDIPCTVNKCTIANSDQDVIRTTWFKTSQFLWMHNLVRIQMHA